MASWTGFALTNLGLELEAKINRGDCEMEFTKMAIGSGTASGSQEALTELVKKEMDMTITAISQERNIVTLNSVITNDGLEEGFQAREMGLYATDPDEGEILFAYQTDPSPDSIPAEGTATVVSMEFVAHIIMSNTANVSAVIDPNGFVSQTMLEEAIEEHNTSSSAHADIRAALEDVVTEVTYDSGTMTVEKVNGSSNSFAIEVSASDIDSLNELISALQQQLSALEERVSALESASVDLPIQVNGSTLTWNEGDSVLTVDGKTITWNGVSIMEDG